MHAANGFRMLTEQSVFKIFAKTDEAQKKWITGIDPRAGHQHCGRQH